MEQRGPIPMDQEKHKLLLQQFKQPSKSPTMDDDIDIEEHDVLDNPRIKSIFPDLSRVKIEVPDDEEELVEEQYGILDPTEEPQDMQYQYEYSFETADDMPEEFVQDGSQEELEEDGEDEENGYFYDNQIILGSKPSPDFELLYEEALTSQPIVYLENWEDRLKSSPCFCDTCEILFPTVNALDAHKMISHSYLVAMDMPQKNTARKSTATSKYCNHCAKTFPDDTSLIKHLYELLPLNNFSKVKEEKIEPDNSKKKFSTSVPWPKKIKIEPREVKIEPLEKDVKPKLKGTLQRDGKFFAASSLVPKSTLFQCNVCQVGFLSCFGAAQHAKLCRKLSTFDKCGICKRKIRSRDAKTHELQHTYNDKLKIYTMNKSIYERVLCKCPKCLSCFDELAFWAHYPKCKKSDKKSIFCPDCDVNIALSRYRWHRLKHTVKKLTKKDFIIVEFYDQNSIKTEEKRLELLRIQKRERQRMYKETYRKKQLLINEPTKREQRNNQSDNDIKVYYCELCGCCQCRLNYKGHTDGLCKRTLSKKYCEKCGLCFTSKSIESHQHLHERRSFTLKDISIISLTTGKAMEPQIPDFYQCHKCTKNFLYRSTLHRHDCKTEKYISCKICSKKYNVQAYKIHKIFHSFDKLMPALMKQYNLINNMWNVMYMCMSCDLVTMTYDSAVTHSQGHLNYIISDLHKQCLVCDLRIAEKEFTLHEKLHSNNVCIERESFKILKYNFEDLFKKEWLLLFKDLPREHRQQILSNSIYRFTRSVKMQIEINASANDPKYFCMNCNTFIDGPFVKRHIKSKCSRNNKFICSICNEVFKSLKQFLLHEGSHENVTTRHTIVTFNNECDVEFNNHLSLIESKDRSVIKDIPKPKSVLRDLLLSEPVKATYKLYKCAQCETCLTLKSSVARHRCVWGNKRRFCDICQQYFCAKKTALHAEAHKKKPFITKDSFYVVYYNGAPNKKAKRERALNAGRSQFSPVKEGTTKVSPKKEVVAKVSPKKEVTPKKVVVAKIFKCQCGLHFTSMKTVEKHLELCEPDYEVSKETCSKCKLVFPTDVLVNHLLNHHHKQTKIVIEKVAKTNLFKCSECFVIFTDMASFDSHTENCDPKNSTHCKNCGLKFSKKCFPKHLCSSNNMTYMNKITVVRKKVVKEAVVYRCVQCDVTYLQRNSFKYHTSEVNHSLKKPPTACDVCGLKFTNCSFRKHMGIHSFPNEDYKIKVIEPDTGKVLYLTGNNRVKDDGNTDSRRSKRRSEMSEETSPIKKPRTSLRELDTPLSERKSSRRIIAKASTSRDSGMEFDDTPNQISVPDEISIHDNVNNVTDTDIDTSDMISPGKNNDTLDKNGLSSRLKSRIIVKGYGRELYKCDHCNLHYMKKESYVYHFNRNPGPHEFADKFKCEICDLEFSKHTLPRHKYVHHDNMGLKKEDFIILTDVLSNEQETSEEIKVENVSEVLDTSTEVVSENDSINNTKVLSDVNVSDNIDTEILSDVNNSDNFDAEIVSEINNSDNIDAEIHSEIINSDNCDAKNLSGVNVSDICDTNSENVSKVSSDVNISDTEILSDVNVSEINDNINVEDKICYFKCSDCNVCFVDQKMCFDHTLKHEVLDPKTYIQCKICDFQFSIDSLKEHMVLHHNTDFMIERLTIHEYKSVGMGLDPKIDIYQAVDKVQSRLVSTTTDVGIV